ncbi:phage tail assembly protein T [Escherichia coli]|nr:phage tail assembly protein T [Escherichia coli]
MQFVMRLAREFRRADWRRMLSEMSATELGEWGDYFRMQSFSDVWMDAQFASLKALIVRMVSGSSDAAVADFSLLPEENGIPERTDEELMHLGEGTHSLSGSTNAAGNHSHRDGRRFNPSVFKDTYQYGYTSSGQNTWGVQGSVGMSTGWLANTSTDGNHSHSLSGTAASAGAHAHTVGIGAHTHSVAIGSHGHTITVNAAGNAENTVKNIAFNYIVRLA